MEIKKKIAIDNEVASNRNRYGSLIHSRKKTKTISCGKSLSSWLARNEQTKKKKDETFTLCEKF